MTLAARWLVGFALVLAGCSVNHRSGDFACEKQSDCSTGRNCIDGFCVALQADASVLDANVKIDAPLPIDASLCPMQCTSCGLDSRTCTIDCMLNGGACNGPIKCPEGWNCNVLCSTINSCRNGLDCATARSCNVTCSGRGSCNKFACGASPCTVDCSGRDSCTDISCGTACSCDVSCAFNASCSGITCTAAECILGRGCTSLAPRCNSCPSF